MTNFNAVKNLNPTLCEPLSKGAHAVGLKTQGIIGVLLFIGCLNSLGLAKEVIEYRGIHNGYPIIVETSFDSKKNQHIITASIKTNKIKETNTTIVEDGRLVSMTQVTDNDIDSEYFNWSIFQKGDGYRINFKNNRFNEKFNVEIKKNAFMSLQGLIYQLRNQSLNLGDVIKANMIVPWKTILPIRFIVDEKSPFTLNGELIEAIKISVEIDVIFGTFLPKSTLWVTEEKPHVLLKQSGLNKTYTITKRPNPVGQPK